MPGTHYRQLPASPGLHPPLQTPQEVLDAPQGTLLATATLPTWGGFSRLGPPAAARGSFSPVGLHLSLMGPDPREQGYTHPPSIEEDPNCPTHRGKAVREVVQFTGQQLLNRTDFAPACGLSTIKAEPLGTQGELSPGGCQGRALGQSFGAEGARADCCHCSAQPLSRDRPHWAERSRASQEP